jgi:hypothetical protein
MFSGKHQTLGHPVLVFQRTGASTDLSKRTSLINYFLLVSSPYARSLAAIEGTTNMPPGHFSSAQLAAFSASDRWRPIEKEEGVKNRDPRAGLPVLLDAKGASL